MPKLSKSAGTKHTFKPKYYEMVNLKYVKILKIIKISLLIKMSL